MLYMLIEQNLYGSAMFSNIFFLILFSMHFVTNVQSSISSKHRRKSAHNVDIKSKAVGKLLVDKFLLLFKTNK